MKRIRNALALTSLLTTPACGATPNLVSPNDPGSPLRVQRVIELPTVAGRIDHLAVDVRHRRIFVAELGNSSVDAVDLDSGASHRIGGLSEPQGLAYLPDRDELVVASAGDGTVRLFDGASLAPVGSLQLGSDADNVRVDQATGLVVVGYGSGAIAFIDPARRAVVKTIALPAHPEGFRLDPAGTRLFVNLPNARIIAAVDRRTSQVSQRWAATHLMNFPMAFDPPTNTIAVVYRWPSRLALLDAATGATRQDLKTCGDADDVYFDLPRKRVYVVCGSGAVDVFQENAAGFVRMASVATRRGARTGLFVPEFDLLIVAERAGPKGTPASLIVLRPSP